MQVHAADARHQDGVEGRVGEEGAEVERVHPVQDPDADAERAEAQAGQQARQDRGAAAQEAYGHRAAHHQQQGDPQQPPVRGHRRVVAALVARGRRQQHQRGADDTDRGPFLPAQPDAEHLHAQHGRDHQVGADHRLREEEGQQTGGQGPESEAHEVQDGADDEFPGHRRFRGGRQVGAAVGGHPGCGRGHACGAARADGLQHGSRAVADGRRDSGQQAYEHQGLRSRLAGFAVPLPDVRTGREVASGSQLIDARTSGTSSTESTSAIRDSMARPRASAWSRGQAGRCSVQWVRPTRIIGAGSPRDS